jgi:NADH dehydrogenase FAD-containing subunit
LEAEVSHSNQQTVILGGGFTGLFTALYLSQHRYSGQVLLIDQSERFIFKPLLYEFLNGQMDGNQVCPRYQNLLQGTDVTFVQDTVQHINLTEREVELVSGLKYTYTNLVLALGGAIGYFGTPGAAEHAFTFYKGEDALAIRQHITQCFQRASQTEDPQLRRKLLTIAVIGSGPTGVELVATLADSLPAFYAQFGSDPQEIRIVLVSRSPDILSGDVNSRLRQTAKTALQERVIPVELVMGAAVTALHPGQIEYIQDSQPADLDAETIIWTAGTAVHPLVKNLPISEADRDSHGHPFVTPTLNLLNYPEVFAGGDCVTQPTPEPALAQVAYQQAKTIAQNLIALSKGEALKTSHVSLRGTLLKLGMEEGAADVFNRYEVKGELGYVIRQLTYLEMLPLPAHNLKVTAEWLSDGILNRAKYKL